MFHRLPSALFAALCFGLLGCGGNSDSNIPNPAPPEDIAAKLPGGPEFADAKKTYAAQGCANCHMLGGTGRGPNAPGLSKVGAEPEHTPKWLADHIRDPKSHRSTSRMPAYGADKIGDADLEKLAAYLAAQK